MADSDQRSSSGGGTKARRDDDPKARRDDEPSVTQDDAARADEVLSTDPPQPSTVGGLLKQARIEQDLSVEQLATELRIEVQQLVALEQDRFERIGVPVFVKGYIKQYGSRLGLDTGELLATYYKQGKLEDIDIRPSRSITLRDHQGVSGWVVALLVLLVIVAALAAWWLSGEGFNGIALPTGRSDPAAVPAAVPAAGLPAPAARAPDAAAGAVERLEVEPAQTPVAPPPAQPTPGASTEPPAAAPVPEGAVRPAPEAAVTPQAAEARVALRPLGYAVDVEVAFEQDSWAEITDARGARLYYGLGSAGRRATLRGEPPLAVVLGNVDGVRIKVEGADYEIPRPKQGSFARFTLEVDEE
jgi:cytoskeleton protein RodZ